MKVFIDLDNHYAFLEKEKFPTSFDLEIVSIFNYPTKIKNFDFDFYLSSDIVEAQVPIVVEDIQEDGNDFSINEGESKLFARRYSGLLENTEYFVGIVFLNNRKLFDEKLYFQT